MDYSSSTHLNLFPFLSLFFPIVLFYAHVFLLNIDFDLQLIAILKVASIPLRVPIQTSEDFLYTNPVVVLVFLVSLLVLATLSSVVNCRPSWLPCDRFRIGPHETVAVRPRASRVSLLDIRHSPSIFLLNRENRFTQELPTVLETTPQICCAATYSLDSIQSILTYIQRLNNIDHYGQKKN